LVQSAHFARVRKQDADDLIEVINADMKSEMERLTKHCDDVLSKFDNDLKKQQKEVAVKVKAAKEEAARLYETMRNAEARVKSLEINHVKLMALQNEFRDEKAAAEKESAEASVVARDCKQAVVDREIFWQEQSHQIKATVGEDVVATKLKLEEEKKRLQTLLMDFPGKMAEWTKLYNAAQESLSESRGETKRLKEQVEEIQGIQRQMEDQMRTASPRAKMLCSLGAAENHIWRMTTFDKMREADDERASALKAVAAAEDALSALKDPEEEQMKLVQSLLADASSAGPAEG
jgi:DNA repair exonuclease SbcCD ATPase subunit